MNRIPVSDLFWCLFCDRSFKNRRGLSKHLTQRHRMNFKDVKGYYDDIEDERRSCFPEEFIQCQICKRFFRSLSFHVVSIHNISSEEYKKKYGSLVSENTAKLHGEIASERWFNLSDEEKTQRIEKRLATFLLRYGKKGLGGRKPGFKHSEERKEFMRNLFSGKDNPFYGRKHTDKTRQQMRKNHADFSGENNPFANKYYSDIEFQEAFKDTHLALWEGRDKLWRKDFGEKISKSLAESVCTPSYKFHKYGYHYSWKCVEGAFYRSSWEMFFMECSDELDIVSSYKIEPFRIEYYDDVKGTYRNSRPDFMVYFTNGEKILVEIKPEIFIKDQWDKILEYESYCLENGIQFILLVSDCFFNKDKVFEILNRAYSGSFYLYSLVRQGYREFLTSQNYEELVDKCIGNIA